ncbi:DUF2330 domain-containing protein [Desulfobacterales bacterium HSG2]|nr:DUF2330 domain-containing protein [Desulfobacterales bacterium HSG2]
MSDGQNQKFARRLFRCLMLAALVHIIVTGQVLADGCFVWDRGADLNEPSQKAVIWWDGTREVLLLQVRYEGPAEDFAWIVPLPSKPEISAVDADKSPFAEISLYTQKRIGWAYRSIERGGVTVLERRIAGVYDIAVLSSADAGALGGWLNRNGFAFPASRTDVLEHYTRKGWVYAAMRIDRKSLGKDEISELRTGELQPVRFSFPADEAVYPLRISSVNAGETEIQLYVLADAPVWGKGPRNAETSRKFPVPGYPREPTGFSIHHNIILTMVAWMRGTVDPDYGTYRKVTGEELPLTYGALGIPAGTRLSLCRFRERLGSGDMTDDIVFERFDPVPYYERLMREYPDSDRYRILSVLYRHDREKYGETYLNLLRNRYVYERLEVAENPDTPPEILRELSHDSDKHVREKAMSNLRERGENHPATK